MAASTAVIDGVTYAIYHVLCDTHDMHIAYSCIEYLIQTYILAMFLYVFYIRIWLILIRFLDYSVVANFVWGIVYMEREERGERAASSVIASNLS